MAGLSKRKSTQAQRKTNQPTPIQPSDSSKSRANRGKSSNCGCFIITLAIGIILALALIFVLDTTDENEIVPNASGLQKEERNTQLRRSQNLNGHSASDVEVTQKVMAGKESNQLLNYENGQLEDDLLVDWCPTCIWNNTIWTCKRRMHYLINFYHYEEKFSKLSLLKEGLCSTKNSEKKTR